MPATSVEINIGADSAVIFDLIHDYSCRLEWDPFLREATLLNGARRADVGVVSRCVARNAVGGLAMDTEYISFLRPSVAAVSMTRAPFFLRNFAASIRQKQIESNVVRVTYRYYFEAKPRFLAFIIKPIVDFVIRRETQIRLAALKFYLE
ncbi:SRPBCC family protein [Novipirellula caenicola]|uniref:Polyketide cyclase / dehydrase and lipid transport n=1 Tax=Novipirellula caenicola TaxID=1536901 RepID=A0ABP9VVP9_9BACT